MLFSFSLLPRLTFLLLRQNLLKDAILLLEQAVVLNHEGREVAGSGRRSGLAPPEERARLRLRHLDGRLGRPVHAHACGHGVDDGGTLDALAALHAPHVLLELVRVDKALEGELVAAPADTVPPAPGGRVDVDGGEGVLDHAAARAAGAGGLLDVAIRDLVEGDGLGDLALVLAVHAAAGLVAVRDVLDAVAGYGHVLGPDLVVDVVPEHARVDEAAHERQGRPAHGVDHDHEAAVLSQVVVEIERLLIVNVIHSQDPLFALEELVL
mmetsp:Transcript_5438/g.10369  ORF Transcript_5438/g.10369 Transcript_5438/m.10369 type:complete len:267 (+) Transcript_5438:31-831(+)